MKKAAATLLGPPLRNLLAGADLAILFWDGSRLEGDSASSPAVALRSPRALKRLLFSPNELGLARAYVSGDLEIEGDIFEALRAMGVGSRSDRDLNLRLKPATWLSLVTGAVSCGIIGPPVPPPPEEIKLGGRLHSKKRDAAAINHHYDVSNQFYRLVLGTTMTYSCAYFSAPGLSLEQAQRAKHDLVCRKLGLQPGMHLLDIGCGWGEMAIHAARHYGARVTGITISKSQAEMAVDRVADAGLTTRVSVRLQDYRDLSGETYDAISSIGMFEHVGTAQLEHYFRTISSLLAPGGRILNHAISATEDTPGGDGPSFISRYVFPDGELHEIGAVITALHSAGLEVADVESLRAHYPITLRAWVDNLQSNWDEAQRAAGVGRARVWRMYAAASALVFEAGRIGVYQTLAVKPQSSGGSGLPMTRESFVFRANLSESILAAHSAG